MKHLISFMDEVSSTGKDRGLGEHASGSAISCSG